MKIARGALGVVIGFGAFFGIVHTAPEGLLLSVVWTVVAAVIGGYIAALVAGSHEFPHAAAVGLLMIAMSLISMRQAGASTPGWYQITIAGCGPISAMIGAAIRLLAKPPRTM